MWASGLRPSAMRNKSKLMIELNDFRSTIDDFIDRSIKDFKKEHGDPSSIGIYCCPWAGWLTVNLNKEKSIADTKENCPDFEFVEYDFLDLEGWQDEYEKDEPHFLLKGVDQKHNHDLGDEVLNRIVFDYLKPMAKEIKEREETEVLLQMLDSQVVEVL